MKISKIIILILIVFLLLGLLFVLVSMFYYRNDPNVLDRIKRAPNIIQDISSKNKISSLNIEREVNITDYKQEKVYDTSLGKFLMYPLKLVEVNTKPEGSVEMTFAFKSNNKKNSIKILISLPIVYDTKVIEPSNLLTSLKVGTDYNLVGYYVPSGINIGDNFASRYCYNLSTISSFSSSKCSSVLDTFGEIKTDFAGLIKLINSDTSSTIDTKEMLISRISQVGT